MSDYSLLKDEDSTKQRYRRITKNHLLQLLLHVFPIATWLPSYSFKILQCDIIAGITVGLMVVPQGLAYASIAQLPNQYGLYSSFMGCFAYCVFGTSKDITLGPTAILSLLVSAYSVPGCGDMAVVLSFCVGVILLLMGVLRLGFLLRFISLPVIEGFTSAAAITIACGQLKSLNGVTHTPRDFFGNIIAVFGKFKSWNFYDVGYGLFCILVLLLMRFLSRIKWTRAEMSRGRIVLCKLMWFCGIARNAIVVVVSCIVLYVMDTYLSKQYLTHVADITSGLPPLTPPKFSIKCQNTTTYSFEGILSKFGSGLLVVPVIAFLEALAIGKAFSQLNQYKIRPSQELIALGVANIAGSFVSAYPVTGSFSRTAVNSQSGVKTPLAGLFTGVVVLIATAFLGRVFQYIPKACLGAVIISAVLPMISVSAIREMWRLKRVDLVPYVVTFFGCFYSLEVGLVCGFLVSLMLVLYRVANPAVETTSEDITVLKLKDGLLYPGVECVVNKIERFLDVETSQLPTTLSLDIAGVSYMDFTSLVELEGALLLLDSKCPGLQIVVSGANGSVRIMLEKSRLKIFLNDGVDDEGDSGGGGGGGGGDVITGMIHEGSSNS